MSIERNQGKIALARDSSKNHYNAVYNNNFTDLKRLTINSPAWTEKSVAPT